MNSMLGISVVRYADWESNMVQDFPLLNPFKRFWGATSGVDTTDVVALNFFEATSSKHHILKLNYLCADYENVKKPSSFEIPTQPC
jgi:hypothetical protein